MDKIEPLVEKSNPQVKLVKRIAKILRIGENFAKIK